MSSVKWPYSVEQVSHVDDIKQQFGVIKDLFEYQIQHNEIFKSFVTSTGRPHRPSCLEELTFMPIEGFKHHDVMTGSWRPEAVFLSSGTSKTERSRHLIRSKDNYHQRTATCFSEFYGTPSEYRHLVFMPFYQQNPNSSLLSMMSYFVQISRSHGSQFITDLGALADELSKNKGTKTLIWSVTFGVLDMIENEELELDEKVALIETGGMKGKRKEITRKELYGAFHNRWPHVSISSEYGMCELTSQAYRVDNKFKCPKGLLVVGNELNDPFNYKSCARGVGLNFIDLFNADSCAFIATQDIGEVMNNQTFEVQGRMTNAQLRGCNLMYLD